ncbi:Lysophospholipid acyltransferase [Tieghemiomyces parasiticus]|uniref:Lysophospholipid acyltransferase n=1 Tax=Tieghemiomyces parasiticus TaxID=78921 RepID=A0A9W8E0U0_9FUNG|nr:Lysophospholipid acyltransferase [Tieghemiomyces parasiticus]
MLAPFFQSLSNRYLGGLPADRVQVMACLLLAYPLAHGFRQLPVDRPALKHTFSLAATAFLFLVVQGQWIGMVHILASTLATYGLVSTIGSSVWGPRAVFILTMAHLSLTHIHRLGYDIDNPPLDHSGAQMMLVIKLTSFAYSVYDGHCLARERRENGAATEQKAGPPSVLSARQRSRAVLPGEWPSLLEFGGYVFFFGSFFVGPAFEFADYREFISLRVFRPAGAQANPAEPPVIPDSRPAAYRKLLSGLLPLLGVLFLAPQFPARRLLSAQYAALGLPTRIGYILATCFATRLPFYVAWLTAEGSCILAGLGFEGYIEGSATSAGKVRGWNALTNVHPLRYETAQNIKELLDAWNLATNRWLKNYVFLRLTPPGTKPTLATTLATFLVSALWHGFFPGYYLSFITVAVMASVARTLRRSLRPIFVRPDGGSVTSGRRRAYDIAGWAITTFSVHYAVTPFVLLYWHESLYVWRVNYYLGHVGLVAFILFFQLGGGRWLRQFHYGAPAMATKPHQA